MTTPEHSHLRHRGRRYRLSRRTGSPYWYLQYQSGGKRVNRSTERRALADAKRWASLFLDAQADDNQKAIEALVCRSSEAHCSRVSEILAWAERAPLPIAEVTRRNYVNCLRLFLRKAGLDPERVSAAELSDSTVRAYARAVTSSLRGDQSETASAMRTANSVLHQGAALLSPRYVGHMTDAGLVLPDLEPFRAAVKQHSFRQCAKRDWDAPTPEVIEATLEAWRELGRSRSDPNVYTAIWLALSCGLRAGEIAQARWDWITQRDGHPVLDGQANVKNHSGRITVRPINPYWGEGTVVLAPAGRCGEHGMLDGTSTECHEGVFRRVGKLLRDCGWRTQKTNHGLRALSGCWVAQKYGIYAAQQFLRHSSVLVTEQHYAAMLRDRSQTSPTPNIEWA